jgi:hypothetical protein
LTADIVQVFASSKISQKSSRGCSVGIQLDLQRRDRQAETSGSGVLAVSSIFAVERGAPRSFRVGGLSDGG